MDHDKTMVWTLVMAAIMSRGENAINASKAADDAVKQFEKRRDDGFFRHPSDRP